MAYPTQFSAYDPIPQVNLNTPEGMDYFQRYNRGDFAGAPITNDQGVISQGGQVINQQFANTGMQPPGYGGPQGGVDFGQPAPAGWQDPYAMPSQPGPGDPMMGNQMFGSYSGSAPPTAGMGGGGMSNPNPYLQGIGYGGGAGSGGMNPYAGVMGDDIARRSGMQLGQALGQIGSHAVGVGGLGGGRQGVAQGLAIGQSNDALTGNLGNFYGSLWGQDANRALQARGQDQSFALGQGGLANQDYANQAGFYTQQRNTDLSQAALGGTLMNQGLNMGWAPINNASNIYNQYTGFGTNTGGTSQGGGALGFLGGALGATQIGKLGGFF